MKEFLVPDGDHGMQLSLCDEETDSGKPDGQLHVCRSCSKSNIDGEDWLRDHELVGDKLELALCEMLQETLLSKNDSGSTDWGSEYARLIPQWC